MSCVSCGCVAKRISLGVVHAVGPFIQLIPLNFVLDNNFVTLLCGMLPYLDVRTDAADCLLLLVGQKGKLKDEHRVHLHHIIHSVAQLCQTTQFNDLDRDYPFQKKLGQLLSVLGIQHLHLLAFEQPSHHDVFTRYTYVRIAGVPAAVAHRQGFLMFSSPAGVSAVDI